jgi:toxin FitB
MSFLLDTNAVSEWTKPEPNTGLMRWLDGVDEDRVFLSVVTLAELRYGVEVMPKGRKRSALELWLGTELPQRFDGRIVGVDDAVALLWGALLGHAQRIGRGVGAMDACVAAIAKHHAFTVVTRNDADFAPLGIATVNPWT